MNKNDKIFLGKILRKEFETKYLDDIKRRYKKISKKKDLINIMMKEVFGIIVLLEKKNHMEGIYQDVQKAFMDRSIGSFKNIMKAFPKFKIKINKIFKNLESKILKTG